MAVRKTLRPREAQLAFEAISIEGGLLSPEWLSKIAQPGAQADADYRIHKGLNLRDEIGRYWRIAQAHWADFRAGQEAKADPRPTAERFVLALLRDAFDFASLEQVEPAVLQERTYPIGHASLDGRVPVVIAPADGGLDALSAEFGDGTRKRTAFGLTQEYLNAQDGALWGIASDGMALRILRDNASLTRPAWIEADLQRIFTEDRYPDFTALWLLCHETRFGREGQPVAECALETWRSAGREEGTRAREYLRRGVEEALVALGQGFLSHIDNAALRAELQNGTLSVTAYFNQLLRLVYRLIFLLTVEERGLLHPDDTSEATKTLYANGYGIRRLRERSVKRSAHDRFTDLWDATKVVCRGLAAGEPRLGLSALAGIFASNQCSVLDASKLENRALLLAVFKLAWLREDGSLARVNWRDMGPEELGSVYESLLELVPQIAKDGRQFAFATGGATKGNARKTTGSYYTHDSLVQVLLDTALEPVIADTIARNPGKSVDALLGLSIVDPACGSGHFLLAAGRRLAAHVARLSANGTPSAAEYRHALRQVVGRCIYGVDLNPMAVELCKVSLWMEAVEPGLPLTFLNSHIQHGNALLGTTPELMAKGIPDAAWDPIEGDDKKIASALKKRNRAVAEGQRSLESLWSKPSDEEAQALTRAVLELDAASDTNQEALKKKESQWEGILDSAEYRHQKFVADTWCSAFVWPKQPGIFAESAPTNDLWRQIRDGQGQSSILTAKSVGELAERYQFFHWNLQFPQIFARGGFDVVIGNPPWDRVKLSEQEFFASRSDEIAMAPNALARKKLIAALLEANPRLWAEWCIAKRTAEGESHLARQSGRYPLCGRGDVNTYALFAEHNRTILGQSARAGFIAPTGLATDETTSAFFDDLMVTGTLSSLFDFENREGIFPDVDSRYKFSLISFRSKKSLDVAGSGAEFAFFAHKVSDLSDPSRRFVLTSADVMLVNPNTHTCPIFRSRRDADLTRTLYRNSVVLGSRDTHKTWGVDYLLKMVDPTIHREMLLSRVDRHGMPSTDVVPLYEGKSIYHFDHRYALFDENEENRALTMDEKARADFSIVPRYWLREYDYQARLNERPVHYRGFLSVRDITNVTNERTVITAVRPFVPALNSLGTLFCRTAREALFLCGCLNSFVADYIARQKIGGTHLSPFYLLQLAVVRPDIARASAPWQSECTTDEWVRERVLELTYSAWDLESFACDAGYQGAPFRWDPDRRFLLRCELDAAFFHLYGLSRDDSAYAMDTFPIVRKNDEKTHGEYRTKRVILEVYDAMAEAARTGKPYQTRLSPPPADPRVAHPPREGGRVIPFRPALRPQPDIQAAPVSPAPPPNIPAWSPELLPAVAAKTGLAALAGRWGTTLTGVALGIVALAAVLRNMGGRASRDEVEQAVVLSVLPGLLQSKFDSRTAQKWRRAIGTANISLTSIAALSIPWTEVLRRAAMEHLLEIDDDGQWRAGADIADAPSAEFDARALVSLSWLTSANAAVEYAELVTQLGVLRAA